MAFRNALILIVLGLAFAVPMVAAGQSPLLQWREPIYIIAGFSGIVGLALLLVQSVLVADAMSGIPARRIHVWTGAGLVCAVVVHVAGLWITSPPDVVDVLLFRAPAPFSVWGAVAMWAVFVAAFLAAVRKRIGLRIWRLGHSTAVTVVITGTVVHAWLIEGAMEVVTKGVLGLMVLGVGALVLWQRRAWRMLR
jgi:predicted ferric reductase